MSSLQTPKLSHLALLKTHHVQEIRDQNRLYRRSQGRNGKSQATLAKQFKVSQATISNLINGKNYRSVK